MTAQPGTSSTTALKFVVLLGVVSLFADMTYEGARSIAGPYLALLGASGTIVGLVAGFGELMGFALRLLSGYLVDKTGQYWGLTIIGYGINMVAVPLLALAGHWELAAFFIIAERMGKAIRTPARDAMLSHATAEMGRGWGFGLHEAFDQVGGHAWTADRGRRAVFEWKLSNWVCDSGDPRSPRLVRVARRANVVSDAP